MTGKVMPAAGANGNEVMLDSFTKELRNVVADGGEAAQQDEEVLGA